MDIIAKISKGSKMDQIYLPKNRIGLENGSYVLIKPATLMPKIKSRPCSYNLEFIEPAKLKIINELFGFIDGIVENENIIITGSFLEKGFHFNDIDVIIITNKIYDVQRILEDKFKTKIHIILISNENFRRGLSTDPLYQMMISTCIAKKRFVYKIKNKINYKMFDLHLLKSKLLLDNFDIFDGNEKYSLVRNMIAINLFLANKKLSKKIVDSEIKKNLGIDADKIKQNIIEKTAFLKKYKLVYDKTFEIVMNGIKNEQK